MKRIKSLIKIVLIFISVTCFSQVGIGTVAPDGALDVFSATDGLLIPRVALTTTTSALPLTLPTISELVYNSATVSDVTPGYYYWNGTIWVRLAAGVATNDWSILGNAGTSPATNFIGTTDNQDFVIRRNNLRAGYIGDATFTPVTFVFNNSNTSFGANTLLNPTVNVVAQTGIRNTAFGANTMPSLTSGRRNVGIGENVLFSNTTGSENTAIGVGALNLNTTSNSNVAVGRNALTTSNADNNTAVGFTSLRDNTTGTGNSALGYRTLRTSTGSNNTALGFDAGFALTTGSNNIMIGANTVAPVVTGSDQLNIGNTIYGSVGTTKNVGINQPTPQAMLDITSTTDGLLIPRVALTVTTSALPLTLPSISEIVYNTANISDVTAGFYYWNGTIWVRLATGGATTNNWSVTGNSGLSGTTNFLGTTDGVDVAFRRNNLASGKIGVTSTAYGLGALNAGVASNSSAFGTNALTLNTGQNNVAFGNGSLALNITGIQNTGIGNDALSKNTGSASTAIGFEAMKDNTSGNNGTAVGFRALLKNTTAINNTGIGFESLSNNTSGTLNTAIGFQSMLANQTGSSNTAVGNISLNSNIGSENTAVGYGSLSGINQAASRFNTAIGFQAMFAVGVGPFVATTNVVAIGANALFQNRASNTTAIGFNALQGQVAGATGNTGVGFSVLNNNNAGDNNTAVGNEAGFGAVGSGNTLIGYFAGRFASNTTGASTFVGHQAGQGSTGANNTAVGHNTLTATGASSNSVAIGNNSLTGNTAGNNTAIGFSSLVNNLTGSGNVAIGNQAGFAETGSNTLYISNSNTTPLTSLIYGDFSGTRILRTNSTFQIGNPAGTGYVFPIARGTVNQILQIDGTGILNWVNPTALAITETDPQVSSIANNSIPKWNTATTTLVDGIVTDDGTSVTIAGNTISNNVTVSGNTSTTNFQMTTGANPNYILQSDASGNASWVQSPLNTLSAFRSNKLTNQSLGGLGWEKIIFDSETFDTNSEFAASTFTATKAGIYQVNAGYHTNDQTNNQFYSIGVYVNGTLYQQTTANHFNNGPVSRNINCLVNLAIGDTVEIYVENYIGGVLIDSFPTKTFFEVNQIR